MANPRITEPSTFISNRVLEALIKINLSCYERRAFDFILRKTFGYQGKSNGDWIAKSQFAKALGLDRRLVHRALTGLRAKNMIVISGDDKGKKVYQIQGDPTRWKLSSRERRRLSSAEMWF